VAEKKSIANTGNDSLFANEFLDKYLSLGFGNLPKKEIDILVFGLLNRCGYLKGKNNYEIARNLQIDENRLRRLFLDSSLRTGSSHDFRDFILYSTTSSASLLIENKWQNARRKTCNPSFPMQ